MRLPVSSAVSRSISFLSEPWTVPEVRATAHDDHHAGARRLTLAATLRGARSARAIHWGSQFLPVNAVRVGFSRWAAEMHRAAAIYFYGVPAASSRASSSSRDEEIVYPDKA